METYKTFNGAILVFILLFLFVIGSGRSVSAEDRLSGFEIVREAIDVWLNKEGETEITAEKLYTLLAVGKRGNDPFIIDLRYVDSALPDLYAKAHIPGAVNIYWRNILRRDVVPRLPRNRAIVVYCYNGHIGSQLTALLGVLGYNVLNLRWGFSSWHCDPEKAPGSYYENEDCAAYPIEKTKTQQGQTYPYPMFGNNDIRDRFNVICTAGEAWLNKNKAGEILNEEVFSRWAEADSTSQPFILDVRSENEYANGHVPGAVNIYWKEIVRKENLAHFPPHKQIIVCGNIGGDVSGLVTALLNLLGYDAINLKWGMASWTFSDDVASGRFVRDRDCKGFPVATGTKPEESLYVY